MIQESVANAFREIARVAAMVAVQALQSTNLAKNQTPPTSRDISPQDHEEQPEVCLNVSPFQDISASFLKDIQSGEFFELSKLLPKNLAAVEEQDKLVLTLDNYNSVVQFSKQPKTVSSITETEQWTTVFTTYMSIFTQKFHELGSVGLTLISNFAIKLAITKLEFGRI